MPPDADRLIIDRPMVETGAGQYAAMVRKLCDSFTTFSPNLR